MNSPLTMLVVATALVVVAVALFWPGWGRFWRWRRALEASDRVRVEDALKHLWDCEYRDHPPSLQSLAGALGLTGQEAAGLVERLERMELVDREGERLRLTVDGRRSALRVVRIHRLWERYLADETGLDAREWHAQAEWREHRTTAEQAESLAAALGFPRFDPHGDPIPLATGEIPPPRGVVLTQLEPGRDAEIVHVEDEPEAVFAQITAAGLVPGMRVRVLERSPQRIRLEAGAEEVLLAPVVAANLTVLPLEAAAVEAAAVPLSTLAPGERGEVLGISAACRGAQRRRLLDLGVVPGTRVENELVSPSGDPTAYRIRGALIALRREQAELVLIQRPAGGEA